MFSELLQGIVKLAQDAQNPQDYVRKLGPRRQLVTLNGKQTEMVVDRPACKQQVASIESLVKLIASFHGASPIVYVGEYGVIVELDHEERSEAISLPFSESSALGALRSLENVSQKKFIRILRSVLVGRCTHEQVVTAFRSLEFIRRNDGTSKAALGDESLGKSVHRAVKANGEAVPEELIFNVPLLRQPEDINSDATIKMAVDIDMDHEKISLIEIGDCITFEMNRVRNAIAKRIGEEISAEIPVVLGEYKLLHTYQV